MTHFLDFLDWDLLFYLSDIWEVSDLVLLPAETGRETHWSGVTTGHLKHTEYIFLIPPNLIHTDIIRLSLVSHFILYVNSLTTYST